MATGLISAYMFIGKICVAQIARGQKWFDFNVWGVVAEESTP